MPLSQDDSRRRDLNQLIVFDELQRELEGQLPWRLKFDVLVGGRSPHVGEFLTLAGVDVQVTRAHVLPYNHPSVYLVPRPYEHRSALLEVEEGEANGDSLAVGHEYAPLAANQRPRVRTVFQEPVVKNSLAPGVCHELGAVPEQSPGGHAKPETDRTPVRGLHLEHFGPPWTHFLHYRADVLLRHLYDRLFKRLEQAVGSLLFDNSRPGDLKLVPLPAHGLHENREMQFTPARHGEGIGHLGLLDPQGNVPLKFLHESIANLSGRYELARTAREG